jgi:hypothetical protein
MNECPCEECICLPICRHKSWTDLSEHCLLISNYININWGKSYTRYYMIAIERILNPTAWSVGQNMILKDHMTTQTFQKGSVHNSEKLFAMKK